MVHDPVHAFKTRLHAKIAAKELQAFDCHGARIGQSHGRGAKRVGKGGYALDVLRIALVVLLGLRRHAREGVRIDLGGAGRNMRDAAAGKAGGEACGEERKVRESQKAAIALTERHPALSAKLRET